MITANLGGPHFDVLPPLALYVHIPWCVRKCPYCDFNSHEARGDVPEDAYVDALLTDLEIALPGVWGRKVVTVFLGGGTPSLFSAAAIDRLLAGIRARIPLLPDAEITLEANPEERSQLPLRQGRVINWLEEALAPLQPQLPPSEVHRLAVAIRSATGIEALSWLTDVAGLSREEATALMRWSAHAMLDATIAGRSGTTKKRPGGRRGAAPSP